MSHRFTTLLPAVALTVVATAMSSPAAFAAPATMATPAANRGETRDADTHVRKALAMVRQMEKDPHAAALLQRSKGVLLVPDYGRAALGVGGQGGAGVLLVHRDGKWSGPGFYNFGGASIGLEAGVSAGRIAMVLMDDKALMNFAQHNKFSLNADAGLTIVNYSERAHGDAKKGDVIVWSDTKGAFANASISVTDVNFDRKETDAYYDRSMSARTIADGSDSSHKASDLLNAMPG
jgi:lipid-binding SYLF domain-containing protein